MQPRRLTLTFWRPWQPQTWHPRHVIFSSPLSHPRSSAQIISPHSKHLKVHKYLKTQQDPNSLATVQSGVGTANQPLYPPPPQLPLYRRNRMFYLFSLFRFWHPFSCCLLRGIFYRPLTPKTQLGFQSPPPPPETSNGAKCGSFLNWSKRSLSRLMEVTSQEYCTADETGSSERYHKNDGNYFLKVWQDLRK
jgi:hypothetical protein